MIDELSEYAAGFLSARDGLAEDRSKIYQIGVDVLLSTGITFAGICALGALFHNMAGCFLFMACFMTLRSYAGGYHASTRTRCFFLTCGAYACSFLCSWFLAHAVPEVGRRGIAAVFIALEVWAFFRFVPVENKNKYLPPDWKCRNRRKAWICLAGWDAAGIICYQVMPALSLQVLAAVAVVTILIIWCKPWRRNS